MKLVESIIITGARENNLRDVSVKIPKRKLTIFTGVSGSGKSSLVFDTVAAESQRLVNETYPGFVQGFMPSLARPDVDSLAHLTAAIVVGQEPMAASSRSTFGTATDITGLLRVLFSRAASPRAGGPAAYSFNVPSASGQGAIEVNGTKEVRRFERTGGMCPKCEGTGQVSDIDLSCLVDEELSLADGAIIYPGMKPGSWMWRGYAESGLYPDDIPVREFSEEQKHNLYFAETKTKVGGVNMSYMGLATRLRTNVLSKPVESLQKHMRAFVEQAVDFVDCPECSGTRLARHARESYIAGASIADVCEMELTDLHGWLTQLDLPGAQPLVDAISAAVDTAIELGLGYLTLSRATGTLSGGESQRTRMVRHMGSPLSDVTYVFDEPTAGLHPHDCERINNLLLRLRDKGNTILVVEHNPSTVAIADRVVDLGPGAGTEGGTIVFEGTPAQLRRSGTVTAQYLADPATLKESVRESTKALSIRGAQRNSLQGVDVDIPEGVLTAIAGVAGSGKSSLAACLPEVAGDRLLHIGQSVIKGSRRSNAATYTGALDPIRKAFAKANGVKPGLFSANSEGACPKCNGAGVVYVELGVMDGVDVPCEICQGRRFSADVLEYRLGELNIADVLELSASRAADYLRSVKVPAAAKICDTLVSAGVGYLSLGQPLSTLSGGERQRLKLAAHLADKKSTADVIVLDEPTTGLHPADTERTLQLLDQLADAGNTVICIDHNLAVLAHADQVIELGPGAGSAGGHLVFSGTPQELAGLTESLTGRYLQEALAAEG
nr:MULTISPECIES: excinuclease ABC subunit UvrA [unclassified Corynebacterium]